MVLKYCLPLKIKLKKKKVSQLNADSRSGAGNVQDGPGTSVISDIEEASKVHQVMSKVLRSQPEEAPTYQRWDDLSFK